MTVLNTLIKLAEPSAFLAGTSGALGKLKLACLVLCFLRRRAVKGSFAHARTKSRMTGDFLVAVARGDVSAFSCEK